MERRNNAVPVQWEKRFRRTRQTLLDSSSFTLHTEVYCENLDFILHRIQFGGEKWIKRLWSRLTKQFCTANVSVMAESMRRVMTESQSSGLYQLVNFDMGRIYTGLCHERPMSQRLTLALDTSLILFQHCLWRLKSLRIRPVLLAGRASTAIYSRK